MADSGQGAGSRTLALAGCTDALGTIGAALWHERECMDRLLFRLIAQQLILMSAHTRWLHLADDEVRAAADALADAEATRSAEFGVLAQLAELPAAMTLGELAAVAPDPWPLLLEEHLSTLRELAREIRVISKANADLLRAGEQAIRETLDALPASGPPVQREAVQTRTLFLVDESGSAR